MKTPKIKEPIRLRSKKLSNGNQSLYLDYYNQGTRQYEFLKLYLIPEITEADRKRNAETMRTATAYKATKIVELQNNQFGFTNTRLRSKVGLFDFMLVEAEKHAGSSRYNDFINTVNHLKQYTRGNSIELGSIDKKFCLGFVNYLKTAVTLKPAKCNHPPKSDKKHPNRKSTQHPPKPLAAFTQRAYFVTFVAALNAAVREGIIQSNPANRLERTERINKPASTRCYLTFAEVQRFANTPTITIYEDKTHPAFLFSCFCGLRLSDIEALTWGQIRPQNDNTIQIELTQIKTKGKLYLPLSKNALKYLPERKSAPNSAKVFDLPSRAAISKALTNLTKRAQIDKRVTFHVARHTFATLDLAFGADLYTVSKLLGHTDIKTTQIYAKIVDENKRKAVDLIPEL